MSRRLLVAATGAALVVGGVVLPRGAVQPLPHPSWMPPPAIDGLRMALVISGLALAASARWRWRYHPIGDRDRLHLPATSGAGDVPAAWAYAALAAITLLGAGLRTWRLGSELWLDEVTPLLMYRDASVWQVVTNYVNSNNHVLNTVLVKVAIALFGEREWVVRLPAVLFGIAGVPAMYLLGRTALTRWASLGAALLLAVSSHHIFFSQNARGYTGYLVASMAATAFLVRGLTRDRLRDWVGYALAMGLDFASHLISSFVIAGHGLVGLAVLGAVRARGGAPGSMARRLALVLGVTGWLGVLLYAAVLPQMLAYEGAVYHQPAAGFQVLTGEFVAEVRRGLLAGLSPQLWVAAALGAVVGGVGVLALARRGWPVVLALGLPPLLQAGLAVATGSVISPRFFLLELPLGLLAAVSGLQMVARLAARVVGQGERAVAAGTVALVLAASGVSLVTLRHYYAVPKQAHRAALEWVAAHRTGDELLVVIHVAEGGARYYGERLGWRKGQDYVFVRSVQALDEVLAAAGGRRVLLLTTFRRALHLMAPDLEQRIERGWTVRQRFPATVGDGEIAVWAPR